VLPRPPPAPPSSHCRVLGTDPLLYAATQIAASPPTPGAWSGTRSMSVLQRLASACLARPTDLRSNIAPVDELLHCTHSTTTQFLLMLLGLSTDVSRIFGFKSPPPSPCPLPSCPPAHHCVTDSFTMMASTYACLHIRMSSNFHLPARCRSVT
jgi:hypothetical protein